MSKQELRTPGAVGCPFLSLGTRALLGTWESLLGCSELGFQECQGPSNSDLQTLNAPCALGLAEPSVFPYVIFPNSGIRVINKGLACIQVSLI